MAAFFTAKDGTKLAYEDAGAGLPLLALAGLTRNRRDFDYWAAHRPEGVRLIRMDYRGRGDSGWSDPSRYTVPQEAADALGLLDHLGLAQAAVLGTSRGGLIGLYLAKTAPERLLGLCLNDVGPVIERAGLDRIAAYVGFAPKARSYAEQAAAMPGFAAGFTGVPEGRWRAEAEHHYREEGGRLHLRYDPALRAAFLAAFEGPAPDLWPLFEAAKTLPLALIRGAGSDLLSAEAAGQMRERAPQMLYAEVPGRGHVPFLDEAESLRLIAAFLAACRGAGA